MPESDPNTTPAKPARFRSLAVVALGCAGTNMVVLAIAYFFEFLGRDWRSYSDIFGWLYFDYGFLLDVLSLFMALIVIFFGGQNRRLGFVALGMIVCGFFV